MSHAVITLALIPTVLYLLLISATCGHASRLYDIKYGGYNVSIYEAAVFGGTRRVSSDSSKNWCNYTFKFASPLRTNDSSEWVYPTSFTFRIDELVQYYDRVKIYLWERGANGRHCASNSTKNDLYFADTWIFTTGRDCIHELSFYQDNSYSSASYKIQVSVTPHVDCNNNMSSSSSSISPYNCKKSGECISNSLQCDGFKNCIDGTDEDSWCKPPSWWMATTPSTNRYPYDGVADEIILGILGFLAFIVIAIVVALECSMRQSSGRTSSPGRVAPASTQRTVAETDFIYHSSASASASVEVDPTAPPTYENVAMDTVENREPFEEPPPSYEQLNKQLNQSPAIFNPNIAESTLCPVDSSRF